MPQLDKFTYFTQFFWSCLLFFTFYIPICNDGDGILGIGRILKLRKQLLSHLGKKIRSKDSNRLEDISRRAFSTAVSYMYSSLFEVSQWCQTVDYFGKRRETNVTDMSVVSQGKMWKGANMSFKSIILVRLGMVLCLITMLYFLAWKLGFDFYLLLGKLQSMLLTKSLHLLLSRLGWCGGGMVIAVVFLWERELGLAQMMAPSGEGSSGSGLPASTSQPTEVAHRSDPLWYAQDEIKKPLMADDLRLKELEVRLNLHLFGQSEEIDALSYTDLVETQLIMEKKMEQSLLYEGYTKESILANRNAIRGYLFYPSGVPLKNGTLMRHLQEMQKGKNIPYDRILKAIQDFDLFIE